CIAGKPQTKAKVEAPMKILDEIHAYQGKFNYEELNTFIEQLCNRVNHEHNQGTGNIPILSFQKEKANLSLLPNEKIRKAYKIYNIHLKEYTTNIVTYKSIQ